MSIDAEITEVEYNPDGTATLHLVARDERAGPAGQRRLIVENPKPQMDVLVGTCIWGGDSNIMVGRETVFAKRIGYTRIRLVEPKRC